MVGFLDAARIHRKTWTNGMGAAFRSLRVPNPKMGVGTPGEGFFFSDAEHVLNLLIPAAFEPFKP